MGDSIYRFSFILGVVLFCFGFTYYGTHSPSLCLLEEAQYKACRSANERVESEGERLRNYLEKKKESLDALEGRGRKLLDSLMEAHEKGEEFVSPADPGALVKTESGGVVGREEFLKLEPIYKANLRFSEEDLKDEIRRKSVVNRERLVVLLGSGFGVFGGLGLMLYGFFGWRRFNHRQPRV